MFQFKIPTCFSKLIGVSKVPVTQGDHIELMQGQRNFPKKKVCV